MFQFLRRLSGSLLPRPDRPWREDATSHAPTIGCKRTYSLTDRDSSDSPPSVMKRTKNDLVNPDTECDAASEGESVKGNVLSPVERREVSQDAEHADLEDNDTTENSLSIRPEGVPLPDWPSPSPPPKPECESPELARSDRLEVTEGEAGDDDSVASSLPQDRAEDAGRTEAEPGTTSVDTSAQEVTAPTVEPDLFPETLEVKE